MARPRTVLEGVDFDDLCDRYEQLQQERDEARARVKEEEKPSRCNCEFWRAVGWTTPCEACVSRARRSLNEQVRAGERDRCVNIMQSIVAGKPQIFSRAAIEQLDYITAVIRAGEENP